MNADDLSRVVMSTSLASALSRARENARAQGHGEVTLEHMLMALCEDPDAGLVLAASNVDVMKLKSDASRYLVGLERQAFAGRVIDPGVSADLRRILDAAAAAARGGRRREINGAIVLAAIIGDGKSAASQLLQSQGLTFEGAIRALQRGASIAQPRTSTEDILASARERVQSRSVPVGMKPEEELVEEDEEAFEEPPEAPAAYEEPPPPPAPAPPSAPGPDYDDVPPTAPPRAAPPQPAPARAAPPRPAPPPPSPAPRPAPVRAAPPRPAPPRPAPPLPAPKWEPPPDEAPEIMSAPVLEPHAAEFDPLPEAYDYEQMSPRRSDFDDLPLVSPSSAPPPPPFPGAEAEPSWTPSPSAVDDPYATPRTVPPPLPGQAPPIPAQAAPGLKQPGPKQSVSKAAEPQPRLSELKERRPMGIGAASSGGESPAYAALARGRQGPALSPAAPAPPAAPEPRQVTRPAPAPRAELGQLVENIPRSMRVAVPALIEVRIARAEVQQLAEGLQGGAAAYKHEVTVTKAMSVRLRAPDGGFYIETASPETQWIDKTSLISNDDYASWRWHVTPREKGRRRLQLIISARTVSGDGLAAETALPDQVISVRVRTNYGKSFSRLIGWSVAAIAGGLIAKFGEGALTQGMQIVSRLMKV